MELTPVELSIEEFGHGVPIVLLHGFPLGHTIWEPLVPLLQDEARLILADLRGYGTSPDGEVDHSMRLLAEDVLALLDRLELEKVILAGHSMGGYVALSFAHAYPHRLAGLALIASQADPDLPEKRQARLIQARDLKWKGIKLLTRNMPAALTPVPAVQQAINEIVAKVPVTTAIHSLKGMAEREDANPWLAGIKVPALVLAGTQDKIVPLEKSRTMAQILARGWIEEIDGASHLPMMEKPAETAVAIRQLIRAVGIG